MNGTPQSLLKDNIPLFKILKKIQKKCNKVFIIKERTEQYRESLRSTYGQNELTLRVKRIISEFQKIRKTHLSILEKYRVFTQHVHARLLALEGGPLLPQQRCPATTVIITHVPPQVPFHELQKSCESVGVIRSMHRQGIFDTLPKHPVTYHVTFSNTQACEKAVEKMDKKTLRGTTIRVTYAKPSTTPQQIYEIVSL